MKNKFIHRTAAGLLALTIVAGASSAAVTAKAADEPQMTLLIAAAPASTVSFDAETGVLTLSGKINKRELVAFREFENVKSIVAEEGTVLPEDSHGLFMSFYRTKSIDLSAADTSAVTNMQRMFRGCIALETLDISSFDTSSVTNMAEMFYDCRLLTELDMTGFDTSNVTDMSHMFTKCESLESIDLSGFDTSNVTSMHNMFGECRAMTDIDLSSFDTANVEEMHYMFENCTQLKNIDLSSFDTSAAKDMTRMFSNCSKLEELDLSGFSTENVITSASMFDGCKTLNELTLGSGFRRVSLPMKLRNESGYGWVNTNSPAASVSGTGRYAEFINSGKNTYIYTASTSVITGASIILDGSIGITFHVALNDTLSAEQKAGAYVVFTGNCDENGEKTTVWKNKAVCHVSAKNMTDTITATLYVDGKAIDTKQLSVKDYADRILADPVNYAAEQDIVKAMLNYGGKAQKLFGYSVNKAVDSGIDYTGEEFSYGQTFTKPASIEGLSYYGTSLVLRSKTMIRHYFKLTSGSISDYTFICSGDAAIPKRYNDTDYYYIDSNEINAASLDERVTITVRKGKERMSFRYGAMDYIKDVLDGKDEQSQELKDTALALYWFNKAAATYSSSK